MTAPKTSPAVLSSAAATPVGDSLGPFRVGQQWSVSSRSKTDPNIAPDTVFVVQSVLLARTTVIGIAPGGTDKTPVQIEYPADDTSFLLADVTPVAAGASDIRTCLLTKTPDAAGTFSGTAFHFNISQTKVSPDAFRTEYLKTHPGADDQAVMAAFLQVAADDTGPCTLRLLR